MVSWRGAEVGQGAEARHVLKATRRAIAPLGTVTLPEKLT